ncbi:hypothetical protein K9N68_04345 [Kovacikia minuta CCNUW1]|uniref:WD40 repeat domain-containing protein n=1 Tax=Kovacikia minuta TaxID=2931930 RepID=UPI001CCBCEDA|nr:hypothetical protein [Kovacikia minuta]UBF27202.1 hypothetical protein K9N68_04345 [Kovacikia minuta CCNUW1]
MQNKSCHFLLKYGLLSFIIILGFSYLSSSCESATKIQPTELPLGSISQTEEVAGIAIASNGSFLLAINHTEPLQLLNKQTGQREMTLEGSQNIYPIASFSPDSRTIAVANRANQAVLWDTSSGRIKMFLAGHKQRINGIAFSSDGNNIATSSDDKTIRLWDVRTGKLQQIFSASYPLFEILLTQDGKTLNAADEFGTIYQWNLLKHKLARKIAVSQNKILSVAFSPDGKLVARRAYSNEIGLWSLDTGNSVNTIRKNYKPSHPMIFSPDSQMLAVVDRSEQHGLATGANLNTLKLWNAKTGHLVAQSDDWQYILG